MDSKKHVDESWKESIEQDKSIDTAKDDVNNSAADLSSEQAISDAGVPGESGEPQIPEVNFIGYITSLGYQAMIFLGEVPNPIDNSTEKNIAQAKFMIDTLVLLKDKTKGNLNEQEENVFSTFLYELQLKYVEAVKKKEA